MKKEENIIEKKTQNKKKRIIKKLIAIIIVFALLFGACAFYVNDYYRADLGSIAAFSHNEKTKREILDDETIVFKPENIKAGFIFYPGGKVESTAYIPLMEELAKKDIMCVLLKMPFNLAVLDVNGAEGIKEMFLKQKTGILVVIPWVVQWRQLTLQTMLRILMDSFF